MVTVCLQQHETKILYPCSWQQFEEADVQDARKLNLGLVDVWQTKEYIDMRNSLIRTNLCAF